MMDGSTMPGWPLFLRRELAALYLGLSPSMFDAGVKQGLLPKPVILTGTVKAWHRRDLEAWAEDRRAAAGLDANEWDGAS